jgi:integrase
MPDPENAHVVTYGNARVMVYPRTDGRLAISWREGGKTYKTTRKVEEEAMEFARQKAKHLDQSTGKRWITPLQHERLAWLERLAGGEAEISGFLHQVEEAKRHAGGVGELLEAAKYYVSHGPVGTKRMTFKEAMDVVVGEYGDQQRETRDDIKKELKGFSKLHPDLELLDISAELLRPYIRKEGLSKRSVLNKLRRWTTFFNRCRVLKFWPKERTNPTAEFKRPKQDDKVPEIFTPTTGEQLLKLVAEKEPQHLPYLIFAGWLQCRPTECLRLEEEHFDLEHGQLHMPPSVVQKTKRERWVPLGPEVLPVLKVLVPRGTQGHALTGGKLCYGSSQKIISGLARDHGLKWTPDVLRHSCITYRLQIVKNIDEVAEESGNSPKVIRDNYRRPIPPGWGQQWFQLLVKHRKLLTRGI